jgi:hypothetical protein
MTDAHALRLQLLQAGYLGILPLFGKSPPQLGKNNSKKGLANWQKIERVTPEMLDMWSKTWPDAANTGCLTRTMPTLDCDILDAAAAKACQDFVRERYGLVLTRVGKPPKFAIPFRCATPFKKIVVNLIAPDGSEGQKIEFLADGEQVVVAGEHPETQQPYRWSNGGLEQLEYKHLHEINADEARELVDEMVDAILVQHFGYKRAAGRPKGPTNGGAKPHDGGGGGKADWAYLLNNIHEGREWHDSICALSAKMIAAGMNSGAAYNQLNALMENTAAPKDARWLQRKGEISAAVDSAVAKYGKHTRSSSDREPEPEQAHDVEPEDEPAPQAPTSDATEDATDESDATPIEDATATHIWHSKNYDYPCTPTGEEQPDAAGRIYVRVRAPNGDSTFVPKDELVPKPEKPEPKPEPAPEPEPEPEPELQPAPAPAPQPKPKPKPSTSAYTIADALKVFRKWLALPNPTPIYATLGAIAGNLLPGDPIWLGLLAPPSNAKTELIMSASGLPNAVQASTLTPGALLSGVPKKQHTGGAKGGLLRQIGSFGILLFKDFTSVLSMRQDAKIETLGAMREIFDGSWTRHFGTDGGKTQTWNGKLGLLFGVTGIIDSHYTAISEMGDRYLLCRLQQSNRQLEFALKHAGAKNSEMRNELKEAVTKLFASPLQTPAALVIGSDEYKEFAKIVSLAVRLRGTVERDRVKREIEAIPGAEGPGRMALCLERLLAGLGAIGLERRRAFAVVKAVAMDSVPPLRRQTYEYLCANKGVLGTPVKMETPKIAEALGLPTNTVRRALEDLAAYGLVRRLKSSQGSADAWFATPPK